MSWNNKGDSASLEFSVLSLDLKNLKKLKKADAKSQVLS